MIRSCPRASLLAAALAVSALAGCASQTTEPPMPSALPPAAALPASIPARDLVGRWGYAAFQREADRARTEAAARGHCGQPYVISMGPTGGVMMHIEDKLQELRLKGGAGGKNYVGPADEAAGDIHDREIVSFDGRVLLLRWIDPEVAGRYGTGIYVRCAARA